MYFKQDVAIFTLNSKPLKLVNQFVYLGNNISSTDAPPLLSQHTKWELHKGAACCFEQILEAALYKAAMV